MGARDPFRKHRPDLVVRQDGRFTLPRAADGRCPCLTPPDNPAGERCTEYEHRPRTCRDFTRGSANCVEARRRVGLSP